MYLMKQGDITNSRRVDDLERRIEMLENMLKEVQSDSKPRVGRPPKGKNEPGSIKNSDSSSN